VGFEGAFGPERRGVKGGFEELAEFVLEGFCAVVLALVLDVDGDGIEIRFRDGEGTVAGIARRSWRGQGICSVSLGWFAMRPLSKVASRPF
jgi:hypothetical protein